KVDQASSVLLEPGDLRNRYPLGWSYLLENKTELSKREKGRYEGKYFYQFSRPQNMTEYQYPKIMTPEISLGTNMTFDRTGEFYHTTKVYSFVFDPARREAPEYWLGILNSDVLWFFIKNTGYTLRGGYYTFKTNYLSPFPIPVVDFDDQASVARHDQLVALVKRMLELKKMEPVTPPDIKWKSNVEAKLNEEIDNFVLNLYGLVSL
ncbi:MAG: TaqI-like C-terminal specificity domain-containing protein, partial [Bacteriovoracaceae bacterium]